jgi:hypothetical protein
MMVLASVGVTRVAAGVRVANMVPAARMPHVMVTAVVTSSMPVLKPKESHRRQPGGAEGECEGVKVHGGDDPVGSVS